MKTCAIQTSLNKLGKEVIALTNPHILSCLTQLRLPGMKAEYTRQDELRQAMGALPFEERFLIMVNAEQCRRSNSKLAKSLRDANLRDKTAALENLIYLPARKIDQQFIARISDCAFIKDGRDILLTGATGTGKTFVASSISVAACHAGYSVRTFKIHRLLMDVNVRVNDGTYEKTLADLKKPDLLVLEDFGMERIGPNFSRYFLEVIDERRYIGSKSLLISAQLPVSEWHDVIEDRTAADAIMDRIVNHAPYRIDLKGPSMREWLSRQDVAVPTE
jgi:DNA replication protein DnaC